MSKSEIIFGDQKFKKKQKMNLHTARGRTKYEKKKIRKKI